MKSIFSRSLRRRRSVTQKLEAREKAISEREFILKQTQKLAMTGSWNFDRKTQHTKWSEEMYNIHGLNRDFNTNDYLAVLNLYDEESRALILDAANALYETRKIFNIVARIVTPTGSKKWVRVVAHPILVNEEVSGILGITSDITATKEAEEIVRESEEKFSLAFNSNPDLMVITRESDLQVMDVNEKIFEVLGYTREEVIGKIASNFKFYANPYDRERFFNAYNKEGHAEIECPWVRKDGTIVHIIISSNRLQIKGLNYFITVIKDISARKQAEEKSQKLFELSPDLTLLVELDTLKVVDVNNKLKEVTGYDYHDVLGRATTDFDLWVDENDRQKFFDQLRLGKACVVPLLKKKNGEKFHGSMTASLIDLYGRTHFICVIRDISAYKEAENKIHQNEANLKAILNNTDMDIWSLDRNLRVIAVNDNFRKNVKLLYNADLDVHSEMITTFRDRLPVGKFSMWMELYQMALNGASVSLTDKREEQVVNFSLHPVKNGDDVIGVVGYAKDVTELLRKEEELKAADKRIAALQLTTLRAFMNPHFIFNALNSIQYFISHTEREKAISYLSTFSKLIRNVLVSAQDSAISLRDEIEMLNDYVAIERLRFNDEFDLEIKIEDDLNLSSVQIPSLLIQPFVENAIIHGFSELKRRGKISVSINKSGRYLTIRVEDNGIGRAAALNKQSPHFKHESRAVSITNERLRLINRNDEVSIRYEDLEENGTAIGTRVTIGILIRNENN